MNLKVTMIMMSLSPMVKVVEVTVEVSLSENCKRCYILRGPCEDQGRHESCNGLIWTTETLSISGCTGQDKVLMWNYSIEENERVIQLQWYSNKTTLISFNSESMGFNVAPLYQGRLERAGTSGILLQNLSMLDTGEYTLYPKLSLKNTRDVQSLVLTVYETPTHRCKPVITIISNNVLSCSTNSCGTPEWRMLGKKDPLGNTSYLNVISSWNAEYVLCCTNGPNMKCHNGNQSEFCTSMLISSNNEHIYDKAADHNVTEYLGSFTLAILIMALLLMAFLVSIVALICWRKHNLRGKKHQNANMDKERTKAIQAHPSAPLLKDQESRQNNLAEMLQVVNNVNIDSFFLKKILYSQGTLISEIHASKTGDTSAASSDYEDATSDAGTFTHGDKYKDSHERFDHINI